MRLLHTISTANSAGGGPIEGIKQFHNALLPLGHRTELVCLDAPSEPWLQDFPMPVHPLGPALAGYRYTARLVPWLRRHAPDYDCVIVNGLWQFTGFGAWQALRGTSTPYCVFTHGMLDPWFKHTYPLKHLKKCLYWPWAEYRVLRDARMVCFTTEEERLLARQSFRHYRCQEAVINYGTTAPPGNPQDQRAAFLARFPALVGKRLLLFLGRIHPKKGCDLLIRALATVARTDPTLHLVMAGPDQTGWQSRLERLARQQGVGDRITWTGLLSGDLKWGAFHAADAFVLPSHQENFGIAVAEALACGLPVLISKKVNIWREIDCDGAGLVASDDLEGTTFLLTQWLSLPLSAQARMRGLALQCFVDRFEMSQAAETLIETLRANGIQDRADVCHGTT